MTVNEARQRSFYRQTAQGRRLCVVCRHLDSHARTCAVVEMHGQVEELVAQVGNFVAETTEIFHRLEALVHGTEARR